MLEKLSFPDFFANFGNKKEGLAVKGWFCLKQTQHKNFHVIRKLKPGEQQVYILAKWRPPQDIWVIGTAIGLLCIKTNYYEIYLAISRNPQLEPKKFFVGLKKDWLFYQQRDVYTSSSGINDLVSYHFLPESHGFFVKKGEPLYIKVGAINLTKKALEYDAFCNIYYTLAKEKVK